jgi:CheY-like chemotaxis protein
LTRLTSREETRHVLVVDDEQTSRYLLRQQLVDPERSPLARLLKSSAET